MSRSGFGGAAAAALCLLAAPAFAGFGAVAYDQNTGKYGASFNQDTEAKAFEEALKQCSSPECRVHPVEPAGCGALALSEKDKQGHVYWGGADRETEELNLDRKLHILALFAEIAATAPRGSRDRS